MIKEVKSQEKVGVDVQTLSKALSKDMNIVIPKVIPNLVKDAQVIEGDGGLGTLLLFNFSLGVSGMSYQKEKIVELDEFSHRIALQVIEGGHLDHGFSFYKTTFQLSATGERETLVEFSEEYESKTEDIEMISKTRKSCLVFIQCLESYLVNGTS